MGWKLIGTCFVLIVWSEAYRLKSKSGLCSHRQAYDKSCSHQMKVDDSFCRARIERNNTECQNMDIPWMKALLPKEKHFRLQAYCYNNLYRRRALNVTFSSGDWKEGALRFTLQRQNIVSCVHFTHNAPEKEKFKLFYDCIWHEDDISVEEMKVEYFIRSRSRDILESGNFQFILHPCQAIDQAESSLHISKYQTLIYVDAMEPTFTTVHIQKMPINYQISSYIVKKCHTCDAIVNMENECSKRSCIIEKIIETEIDDEEIMLTVPNDSNMSCFYIAVEAVCHNCTDTRWCVGRSLLVTANKTSVSGMMSIIIPLCLIFVLVLLVIFWIAKQRLSGKHYYTKPVVLFLYNPVHSIHVKIVRHITKILSTCCEIDVLFDEIDISKSFQKDPIIWYGNAVSKANYIAVVSTPSVLQESHTIYKELFPIALRFVVEKMKKDPLGVNIFNITFTKCKENIIPCETQNYRRFQLMNEFTDMITYLQRNMFIKRNKFYNKRMMKGIKEKLNRNSAPTYLELCEDIDKIKEILSSYKSVRIDKKEEPLIYPHIIYNVGDIPDDTVESDTEHIFQNSYILDDILSSSKTVSIHNVDIFPNNSRTNATGYMPEYNCNLNDILSVGSKSIADEQQHNLLEFLTKHRCKETVFDQTINSSFKFNQNMHELDLFGGECHLSAEKPFSDCMDNAAHSDEVL